MVRLDQGGQAARAVRLYPPTPAVRDWVQHASVHDCGPARRGPWRVVPDTSAHVIFTVTASAASCRVVGARSTYADIDVDRRLLTVAIRLQTGALPALLGARASSFTDRAVDVADVFGEDGRRLLGEITGLPAHEVARRLMEAIEARVRDRPAPYLARALAGASRVEDLQRALGLSARDLHRRFLADVGLAPKRALRIERLHAALHEAGCGRCLADAALHARYCDQAHLTRESRSLLGESPAVWRRRGLGAFA